MLRRVKAGAGQLKPVWWDTSANKGKYKCYMGGIKSKIIFISIKFVSNVIDVILNLIDLKMLKDQGYYNL